MQYIPSKPGRYGINIWRYVIEKQVFLENADLVSKGVDESRAVGLGESVIKHLVSEVENSGRNITYNNYFTSFSSEFG